MISDWFKRHLPRSLYGRAALILVLPVAIMFLLVSVVFVQRTVEGVTKQMTRSVSRQVRLLLYETRNQGVTDDSAASSFLVMRREVIARDAVPEDDRRHWYDLMGLMVINRFYSRHPDLLRVDLWDEDLARLYFPYGDRAAVKIEFKRSRATAGDTYTLLLIMAVFATLLTLIAYVYMRKQLRPIKRLASAAEAFGRGQNVPYRPAGALEVRAAGHAFLDMRDRIERQIEQRTLMLSAVSHDMRTPLTRLKLGLSMLPDEDGAPLLRDVTDMEQLLDAFLDFAHGTHQNIAAEPTDVVTLINRVVTDAQRAHDKVCVAAIEIENGASPVVPLHADAIRRAVDNLVGNAVRYGSRAEVSLYLTPRTLCIRVEDDGPGIPPESREEALKPFVRLDVARNQDRGTGVGLGLSIVIDVARSHGGTLRLDESRCLGGLRAELVIAR